jgi:steroid delta-isomerase-like uncharacterized protein
MTESERNLGERWFEQVWNQKRREAIAEMMRADTVLHDGGTVATGPDGFYPFFDRLNAAFSDLRVDVQDSLAEGDRVCVRWICTAKHTGDGLGMAPTGSTIEVTGTTILRVADDKILEAWQNWDMLGMMEQVNGLSRSATYIA